jgi:hypothetical protein
VVIIGGNRAGMIGDARGFEGYYNIEVTPWLHITPNFQIINPSNDTDRYRGDYRAAG